VSGEHTGPEPEAPGLSSHEQAIQWFLERGLSARRQSGWLAGAISVSRPPVHSAEGIRQSEEALILYPEASAWVVMRGLHGRRGLSQRFESLGAAAAYVAATLGGRPK